MEKLPPALTVIGLGDGVMLQLSSCPGVPRSGHPEEELGIISCGVKDQVPLWQHQARFVLGAEARDANVAVLQETDFVSSTVPGSSDVTNAGQDHSRPAPGLLVVHVVTASALAPAQKSMNDSAGDGEAADRGEWYGKAVRATHEVVLPSRKDADAWAAAIVKWANPKIRTIHCIVNPNSGQGRGRIVWEDIVAPVLRLSPHIVHLYETKAPGDVSEYCKQISVDRNVIFAAIGGDGTMHEVLNALMQRGDAERGLFTICFVPAGSANAMSHMLGMGDAATAAWALAKGRQLSMDLFAFHQGSWSTTEFEATSAPRYGFLSVTQGLIADIDIDSESMRCCGETRFTAYAVAKILCCCCCCWCAPVHARTKYSSRIRYLEAGAHVNGSSLAEGNPPRAPAHRPDGPDWQEWQGNLQFFNLMAAPALDKKMKLSPEKQFDDATLHLQWMKPTCMYSLVGEFSRMETSTHLNRSGWEQRSVVAVCIDDLQPDSKVVVDGERAADGKSWQAEVLPAYVNVIVGSGPLQVFGGRADEVRHAEV